MRKNIQERRNTRKIKINKDAKNLKYREGNREANRTTTKERYKRDKDEIQKEENGENRRKKNSY